MFDEEAVLLQPLHAIEDVICGFWVAVVLTPVVLELFEIVEATELVDQ